MSSPRSSVDEGLPAVDDRIAVPETRYVIDDGKLVYVAPADGPHAACHANLTALIVAHVAAEYAVAMDMLTRTSKTDDIAPDVSVFPRARDPVTGGRRLEELAFEVVSTQSLRDAGHKAAKLRRRGVRRCFAVDVERERAFEWSHELGSWSILSRGSHLADPVLAVPLPVDALIRTTKADPAVHLAMAAALIAQGDPLIAAETARSRAAGRAEGLAAGRAEGREEGRAEGLAEGRAAALLDVLALRGLQPLPAERARILAERDAGRLQRWSARALACGRVAELFDGD